MQSDPRWMTPEQREQLEDRVDNHGLHPIAAMLMALQHAESADLRIAELEAIIKHNEHAFTTSLLVLDMRVVNDVVTRYLGFRHPDTSSVLQMSEPLNIINKWEEKNNRIELMDDALRACWRFLMSEYAADPDSAETVSAEARSVFDKVCSALYVESEKKEPS